MKKPNAIAEWSLTLDVSCPFCSEYFDILRVDPDIMEYIKPIEFGTKNSEDYEVACPACYKEFKCDLEW